MSENAENKNKNSAEEMNKILSAFKSQKLSPLLGLIAEQKQRAQKLMEQVKLKKEGFRLVREEAQKKQESVAAVKAETVKDAPQPVQKPQETKAEEKAELKEKADVKPAVAEQPKKQDDHKLAQRESRPQNNNAPSNEFRKPQDRRPPRQQQQGGTPVRTKVFPQQQGRPGQYQQRPQGQGGAPRPKAPFTTSASIPAPASQPAKAATAVKRKEHSGAEAPKKNLDKRSLIKKGYVVDNTLIDDEATVKVKVKKKKDSDVKAPQIVINHAVIDTPVVTIKVLSEKIGKQASEIIKKLFILGIAKTINENIDFDTAALVAAELGVTLEYKPEKTMEESLAEIELTDDIDEMDSLVPRPPIVTIMGHVDHGKTSLLDYIRKTKVANSEAGGITQHIGAYTIKVKGQQITFIDTPGHEAFTAMRARGAQVTDIAIIVIAADDGIMPQTVEAIDHAKSAGVQIIVAVNKVDKPTADPDRILHQLTNYNIVAEQWGGDTPVCYVSAKTGQGVDNLLENILLVAEIMELKANPNRTAKGTIVEARLDKGRGPLATILVQKGTLKIGDIFIAGTIVGRVRSMTDDMGRAVKEAGPSMPVSVTGFDEVPNAGDTLFVVPDEKFAKQLAEERRLKLTAVENTTKKRLTLEDLAKKGYKELPVIIKADVQGSLEALKQSLLKFNDESTSSQAEKEVEIKIIHGGVGGIKESDVILADTTGAIIIGFNVRPDINAKELAERENIDIRCYRVIYDAINDIEQAIKGLLEPKFKEVVLGTAEIREIFKISSLGNIAGCRVLDGKITRSAKVRLIRNSAIVTECEIASLKHEKEDVKEIAKGYECGILLSNFNDIKKGDIIEAFVMEQIK